MAIEKDLPFEPRDPIVLAAFEGWNDAANAATSAVDHLIDAFDAALVGEIDPDEYYDFQVNRPVVGFVGDPDAAPEPGAGDLAEPDADASDAVSTAGTGEVGGTNPEAPARSITWPTTRFYLARPPDGEHDLLLVRGIEPNMRWRAFTAELLAMGDDAGAVLWVVLGALLADVPHTRPIPVNGHSSDPAWSLERDLEPTRYEGPTGINGVIGDACNRLGIAEVSFWAAVPHYVSQPPCPKATLALLRSVEDTLGLSIPLGDLPETARAWERGVAELAANDEEVAEYVRALEDARDTTDLPQASGEAIAAEFESYLRRRERRRGVRGDKPEDD